MGLSTQSGITLSDDQLAKAAAFWRAAPDADFHAWRELVSDARHQSADSSRLSALAQALVVAGLNVSDPRDLFALDVCAVGEAARRQRAQAEESRRRLAMPPVWGTNFKPKKSKP